jgi:hypothetical protein
MRSMTRWTLSGIMALAALAAVAVFDVAPATAAEAASVSPFAGSWSGTFSLAESGEEEAVGTFNLMISDAGRLTGPWHNTTSGTEGTFAGHVVANGNLNVIFIIPGRELGGLPFEGTAVIDDEGKLVVLVTARWTPTRTWSGVATLDIN